MHSLIESLKARITNLELATDGAHAIKPVIYPPASEILVNHSEKLLGFALPPLLRQILMEVGNGGFGPEYGLLGLAGGATDDTGRNMIDLYRLFLEPHPDDLAFQWPVKLVPICHLGCAMYACVDCSIISGPILWWEPNPREKNDPIDVFFIPVAESLEDWFWMWLRNEDWMTPAYERSALKQWLDDWHSTHDLSTNS